MTRCLTLVALATAATLAVPAVASAVPPSAPNRGNPEVVGSSVTPKRDRSFPYRFRTRGSLILPSPFCFAGGVMPGPSSSRGNCVPLNCPAGQTVAGYCVPPTIGQVCRGRVQITIKRGTRTLSNKQVDLAPNCRYASRTTISRRLTRGNLRVSVRFLGNEYLKPKSASTKTVRIGG